MILESNDFSLHDTVALIRLAKPDRANTLGRCALGQLRDTLARSSDQAAVRLVVVTGKGGAFSAGADIREIEGCGEHEVRAFLREGQALLRQIMGLDAITIAAVNGLALGGGMELALACDIRWAHVRAVFGFPESTLGLLPGWGAMSLLRRSAPASLGAEMVVGGEYIGARRAYETGLVSRLFEQRDFEAAVLAEAEKLADRPPGVLREAKAMLRSQNGDVELSQGDRSFLRLWNDGQDRLAGNVSDNRRRRK